MRPLRFPPSAVRRPGARLGALRCRRVAPHCLCAPRSSAVPPRRPRTVQAAPPAAVPPRSPRRPVAPSHCPCAAPAAEPPHCPGGAPPRRPPAAAAPRRGATLAPFPHGVDRSRIPAHPRALKARWRAPCVSPGQYRDPCSPSALEFTPEPVSDLAEAGVDPLPDDTEGGGFGPVETSRGLSLLTKRPGRAILWSSARDAAVLPRQRKPEAAVRLVDTFGACSAAFSGGRALLVSSVLPSGSELGFHKARESDSTAVGLSATLLVCAAFYRMSTFRSRPVTPSTGVGLVEFSGSGPLRATGGAK